MRACAVRNHQLVVDTLPDPEPQDKTNAPTEFPVSRL